jgi:predicted PurR-regulated permease PerM
MPTGRAADRAVARRALVVSGVAVAVLALALIAWSIVDVLLLVFGSVLIAILVRSPADWLARRTRLSEHAAVFTVIACLVVLIGGAAWLFGNTVSGQFAQLGEQLPKVFARLEEKLSEFSWLTGPVIPKELGGSGGAIFGRGIGFVTGTIGAIASLLLVLVMAAFMAYEPRPYVRGLVRLFPISSRPRAEEVLNAIGAILKRWLVGQLSLMVVVGILTGIGLWLLGVPLALGLAVLTALLNFIPYLGPILAAVPAVLIGLSVSPLMAGYVVLLYLVVQTVEGNLLEPLVQRKAIYLPPALILISQLVLGVLVGAVGVMLATPFVAAFTVAVQMLYIEDVLGDRRSAS